MLLRILIIYIIIYTSIVSLWPSVFGPEHRRKIIGLRGFDYSTLQPDKFNILPPTPEIEQLWREDYRRMRDTMIYGESVEFDELIKMMRLLMGICNEN